MSFKWSYPIEIEEPTDIQKDDARRLLRNK